MFEEDKLAFFDDFGEQAKLTVGTVTTNVTVIYNLDTVDFAGVGTIGGFQDEEVSITGLSSEFSSAGRGSGLVIRDKKYTLKNDPRDDFTGFFTAALQEAK